KRSPFDEAECGHHYARAMASWAAITALTGFWYSAPEYSMRFAATENTSQFFWSNGNAWGTYRQVVAREGATIELTVLHGSLKLQKFELSGVGMIAWPRPRTVRQNETLSLVIRSQR